MGAGGNIIIGSSLGSTYRLSFYVKSPALTGAGVFLHPQYVVNSASSAAFTASVAPGEFISLGGAGLAPAITQAGSLPFPVTLAGVQVMISWVDVNGLPQAVLGPLYYVSPTLIDALVPYSVPDDYSLLTFQVNNNGQTSNSARVYSGPSAPRILPYRPAELATEQFNDYSLVSTSSPAKASETVLIYLTGLGNVTPGVTAKAAAPANPPAKAPLPKVYIGGQEGRGGICRTDAWRGRSVPDERDDSHGCDCRQRHGRSRDLRQRE